MARRPYHARMPVVGHGIDVVEVARIGRMLREHGERFRERCFTRTERDAAAESGREAEYMAGRFAAKEAVLKALGTGWRHGIAWTDVEVVPDAAGRPGVALTGQAAKFAKSIGADRWWLSISHAAGVAMASAVAEGRG